MWLYEEQNFDSIPEHYVGFVYRITNVISGKQYIGKKLFYHSKIRTKKGRRKKIKVESDWKEYFGSNNSLLADIIVYGEKNFRREILHLCKTKGTCSYLELKEQILNNVLESDKFYNDQIRVRIHRSHLKL